MDIVWNLPLLQQPGGSMTTSLVTFGLVIAIFYFMIIRPQRKKQKDTQKMIEAMKKGDKVTSIGGIKGVVHQVKEKSVVLKVDDNTKLEFTKSAIASVDQPSAAKAEETKPAKDND